MDENEKKLRAVVGEAYMPRCEWDADEEADDGFAPGGCTGAATFEVEGPHETHCGVYCDAHAKRWKAERGGPYPHRYLVTTIYGASFNAAAVNAVPSMLAELTRLRAQLAAVKRACDPVTYLAGVADEFHTKDDALVRGRLTAAECRAIRSALSGADAENNGRDGE